MNFEKGKKVFYPGHGAGTIKDFKEIEFTGQTKKYVEIELINSDVTLLLPYNDLADIIIRPISSVSSLESAIKAISVKNIKKIDPSRYNKHINDIKSLFLSGDLENTSQMLILCNSIYQMKKKEQKPYPQQMRKYYRNGVHYFVGEYALAKGISYEEAESYFLEKTGFEIL